MRANSKGLSKILLLGGSGLLGSELTPILEAKGYTVLAPSWDTVDCRKEEEVLRCLHRFKPDVCIMAEDRGGGILANRRRGSEFLYENTLMALSTLKACAKRGVPRVLFMGSSCSYPRDISRPIREEDLLTGPLEPTSEGYAIAKIAGIKYAQFLRREGRCLATVFIPTNLYGDRDYFSEEEGHLVGSLIVKMHWAKEASWSSVELWGDGTPRRDLLHAQDAASACAAILQAEEPPEVVNIGSGSDLSVREIASQVAFAVGYRGEILFTGAVSNGAPRKLLSIEWLTSQGWKPRIPLEEGLRRTYQSYLSQLKRPAVSAVGLGEGDSLSCTSW